jgi:hypothetical protein
MIAKHRTARRKRLPQKRPRWSWEELKLFLRLFPKTPNVVIARLLGRSVQGIASLAHKLELKKHPQRLVAMGRENISRRWGKKRRGKQRRKPRTA